MPSRPIVGPLSLLSLFLLSESIDGGIKGQKYALTWLSRERESGAEAEGQWQIW